MSEFQKYIDVAGWHLCRIKPGTKSPTGKAWNRKENALRDADGISAAGLMHAYSGTMALDVDDYDRAAAWLAERGVSLDELFAAPESVQIVSGREGSAKLLYAFPVPLPSAVVRDGRDTILEFRCATADGLSVQDVLPPSVHPDTGRPYAWAYGNEFVAGWECLPPLPDALEAIWRELMAPAPAEGAAPAEIAAPAPSAELAELRDLLRSHDPDSDRATWIRVGAALHYETQGSAEGLALWDEWSRASEKYKGPADLEKDWRSFRLDKEIAATAGFLREGQVATPDEFGPAEEPEFDPWEAANEERRARFEPVHISDVARRPPPEWLVHELLPRSDLAMLYGQPGAGKSYIALDLAFAISTGEKWGGLETQAGPVAWIAAEAAGSLRLRAAAYARQHGMELENADLWIVDSALSLMDTEDATALTQALVSKRPKLIIVDTLAAASGGANENSGEDMNKVLDSCRLLHRETGATVLLVHHSGKDEGRGARGWSGIKAAVQTELLATNNEGRRTLRVTKQRDGVEGDMWPIVLVPIPVTDDLEACTVEVGERILPAHIDQGSLAKLRGVQAIVMRAIADLSIIEGGGVLIEDVYDTAADMLPPPPPEQRDRRKFTVKRNLETLVERNYLTIAADMVFIREPEKMEGK